MKRSVGEVLDIARQLEFSLGGMERVVGLEDVSDVSTCTQHQLVGTSRVTGYELTDIVHLCKSMGCHL